MILPLHLTILRRRLLPDASRIRAGPGLGIPDRDLPALLESGRIGTDGQQDIASARRQRSGRFAPGSRGSMGTDVEASCAAPSRLPIPTPAATAASAASLVLASAPGHRSADPASAPVPLTCTAQTVLTWDCDQSHRIEHSSLPFAYCGGHDGLLQPRRSARSRSWARLSTPMPPTCDRRQRESCSHRRVGPMARQR